jgi:hypothetical protein
LRHVVNQFATLVHHVVNQLLCNTFRHVVHHHATFFPGGVQHNTSFYMLNQKFNIGLPLYGEQILQHCCIAPNFCAMLHQCN